MGYDLGMVERQVRKTKKIMKILGAISGGLSAVILPLYFLVKDIRADVRSAEKGTEAVAAGGGVAVGELQSIVEKMRTWADNYDVWRKEVDAQDDSHVKEIQDLKSRITYLEGYIQGRYRNFDPEDRPKTTHAMGVARKPPPPLEVPKPQAPIIDSVKEAQQFQKARKELKCASDDPACGADAVKLE